MNDFGTWDCSQASSEPLAEIFITLITQSIEPQSWLGMGGAGTIKFFPMGKALIVNQVPDVQGQVQDWLTGLRNLKDEVAAAPLRPPIRFVPGAAFSNVWKKQFATCRGRCRLCKPSYSR